MTYLVLLVMHKSPVDEACHVNRSLREAWKPLCFTVVSKWSYLACFLSLAPSITVSKGIVNSTSTSLFVIPPDNVWSEVSCYNVGWKGVVTSQIGSEGSIWARKMSSHHVHNYFQDSIMSLVIPPQISGNWATV